MQLGKVGVWWSGSWQVDGDGPVDVAAELESLGFGAIWSTGGFEPGLRPRFGRLLSSTSRIVVASGIVSVWSTPAVEIANAFAGLEREHPGRFLLGLGASHAPVVENYSRPFSHVVGFLDDLDALSKTATSVVPSRRILAALGPKMLELAASRSAGAHPYFVPVEHTAQAREILGTGPLLAPELTVVLESEAPRAREVARTFTAGYLSLPNYANNLRSLGFAEDDVHDGGSDRLVDAVVAWGDMDAVVARIRQHLDAGADHVCIQVLSPSRGFPLNEYRRIAEAVTGL